MVTSALGRLSVLSQRLDEMKVNLNHIKGKDSIPDITKASERRVINCSEQCLEFVAAQIIC